MMNRAAWIGLVLGVGVLIAAYVYIFGNDNVEPPVAAQTEAVAPVDETPDAATVAEPVIEHPMPEVQADASPLPPLEESDEQAIGSLRELFGRQPVESFLIPKEIIRRLVVFVDSLDRDPLPLWLRPIRHVPGGFQVAGDAAESLRIDAANAARYAPLVAMLESVDATKLAAVYRRYYPLFQDAYDRLGNPRAHYFNDRLIGILDHLLATPVVEEPVALVRPKVLYLFADPQLEQRSSGQKALLRMGRENQARALAKLREIRSAIMALPAASGAPAAATSG